jgi:phosphatidylinositol alpha-1,6-mannosyltransferase
MKKILMLTYEFPPITGGIATYTAQLASAASKIGHRITVLAPGSAKDHSRDDKKKYPFTVIRFGAGDYSYRKILHLIWRTYVNAKPSKYDLIHPMDWPHTMALSFLNRFRNIPFVATVYGTEILLASNSRQIMYLGIDNMFAIPNHLFAISEFTKNLLLEKYKEIRSEDVTVTPPGVDFERYSGSKNNYEIRRLYSIPEDNHIILTVSRLDERKGHRTVIKALSKLAPELRSKTTYIIAGVADDGDYVRGLKQQGEDSGIDMRLIGKVDHQDLPPLYASSTVFCMPGEPYPEKIEGFGLVYLEAAATGLPCIASRIGGVPEAVVHKKTGILIEPGDSDALATALTRILIDRDYRAALSNEALNHASSFTWDRCARLTYGPNDQIEFC